MIDADEMKKNWEREIDKIKAIAEEIKIWDDVWPEYADTVKQQWTEIFETDRYDDQWSKLYNDANRSSREHERGKLFPALATLLKAIGNRVNTDLAQWKKDEAKRLREQKMLKKANKSNVGKRKRARDSIATATSADAAANADTDEEEQEQEDDDDKEDGEDEDDGEDDGDDNTRERDGKVNDEDETGENDLAPVPDDNNEDDDVDDSDGESKLNPDSASTSGSNSKIGRQRVRRSDTSFTQSEQEAKNMHDKQYEQHVQMTIQVRTCYMLI
jgi:hypothetical protein